MNLTYELVIIMFKRILNLSYVIEIMAIKVVKFTKSGNLAKSF